MAKGTGLIGNFKGKVGNTVGYKLSASNNGQTQGIRVYQPIVKNPKTAAQAEQRAKLLAVNATYRALKMVIDRGNEGLPYGNKSRLAWLKGALKAQKMPWYEKGALVTFPVGCQLTKGTLPHVGYNINEDEISIAADGVTSSTDITTIGKLSAALKSAYSFLKEGDQITIVSVGSATFGINAVTTSFIVDTTSTVATSGFTADSSKILFETPNSSIAGCVIISRLGENGEHMRSQGTLSIFGSTITDAPYDADSKAAAIASYQSSGYVNADWQEESVQ